MKIITNGKIIIEDKIIEDMAIVFSEVIESIIPKEEVAQLLQNYPNISLIDANGKYVSAGFIDLHIHGAGGSDAMDGTIEDLTVISQTIAKTGVTAFLPTTMTMSKEKIHKALDTIKVAMESKLSGAKVIGAHMEGPFINLKYKGAQNPEYIVSPEYGFIENYLDIIKILTLAPEMDTDLQFINKMKDHPEVVLSIGHSNATFEQAMEAIEEGVTHVTHTFNAMSPLNHRKPGIVGAALCSDVYCELIADGIHVHPGVFQLMTKTKGKDKLILVTDSIRAGCLKEGISELGGQKVIIEDNSARLEDGTLAGSVSTLNKAVKNFFQKTNLSLPEVIGLVTMNPAKDIGIFDTRGSIAVRKFADLIVFDDSFEVDHTFVEGDLVYRR